MGIEVCKKLDGYYFAMIREIGGYFELELDNRGGFIHDDGLLVNTGRNALELILRNLPSDSKVYVPKYTCDVVLEPFAKLGIPYILYSVNKSLELNIDLQLGDNEYLLYTNYFGVKDSYVRQLVEIYPGKLIVDNAQALYASPTEMCFYSPRKFVGIPDGGIAYLNKQISLEEYEQDYSYDRCSHLLKRLDIDAGAGYSDFKTTANMLRSQPITRMSNLTKALLGSIDFAKIRTIRLENFRALHSVLKDNNKLVIEGFNELSCPMVYPFMTDDITLRQRLINNKIFVAKYWPNIYDCCDEGDVEYTMCQSILPLPIDQRYSKEELNRILTLINNKC